MLPEDHDSDSGHTLDTPPPPSSDGLPSDLMEILASLEAEEAVEPTAALPDEQILDANPAAPSFDEQEPAVLDTSLYVLTTEVVADEPPTLSELPQLESEQPVVESAADWDEAGAVVAPPPPDEPADALGLELPIVAEGDAADVSPAAEAEPDALPGTDVSPAVEPEDPPEELASPGLMVADPLLAADPPAPAEAGATALAVEPVGEAGIQVSARAPGWPFLIYFGAWLVMVGLSAWFILQMPLSETVFRTDLYQSMVRVGLVLTAIGPVLGVVVWLATLIGTRGRSHAGLLSDSLIKAAYATLGGVAIWWATLLILDYVRLGKAL